MKRPALSRVGMVAAFAAALGLPAHAQPPELLVVNQGDATITVIDPALGNPIATIPEHVPGVHGHEAAVTSDGRTAFVPIYGSVGVGQPGLDGKSILVIDLPTRKIVNSIQFGHGVRPHCAILDPVSGLLYVTTELDRTVTAIDPKTFKIVGAIPTTQPQSHMLAISHSGSRGYTANVEPGTVSVLDMKARKTLAVIPVSRIIQRIAISNDDSMVFTADQAQPRLAVIDAATNRVKTWVPLAAIGFGITPTRDGRWLLVAMPAAAQVAVIDLRTLKIVKTIPVPSAPQEVLMRPDGKVAYVSCNTSAQVAEIDLSQWKVTKLFQAGKGADGLAWAH